MEFGRSSRNHHAHVDSLEELCRNTKFSKKEIQLMYRSFKQECPTGYVEEDTFRQIFSHFFPYGNASLYAHYVFKTFDKNRNGAITFKDFIQCLSLMCRGSIQEKLQWAFKLYDINGDGRITKKELMDIVCSVYALVGRRAGSTIEEKTLRDHVDKIFQDFPRLVFLYFASTLFPGNREQPNKKANKGINLHQNKPKMYKQRNRAAGKQTGRKSQRNGRSNMATRQEDRR